MKNQFLAEQFFTDKNDKCFSEDAAVFCTVYVNDTDLSVAEKGGGQAKQRAHEKKGFNKFMPVRKRRNKLERPDMFGIHRQHGANAAAVIPVIRAYKENMFERVSH